MIDAAIAHSAEIVSGQISLSTRRIYKGKYKHFRKFVQQHYITHYNESLDEVNFGMLLNATSIFEAFFGHISKFRDGNDEIVNPVKYHAFEYVSGYKSAIKFYFYNVEKVELGKEVVKFMEEFIGGYKRKIAALKLSGDMEMIEGKQPLSFDGYQFFAKKAFYESADFSIGTFAHVFIVLCWNLMARCVSVSSLMYDHISWSGDAMTVRFPAHKGDQEGKINIYIHNY